MRDMSTASYRMRSWCRREPARRSLWDGRFASLLIGCLWAGLASAQSAGLVELNGTLPPELASPDQRLMMEQVEELIAAREFDEAIANLEKLFDLGSGKIVEVGSVQSAGTLMTLRYVPLRDWVAERLTQLLLEQPELRQPYQARMHDLARATLERLQGSKDISEVQEAVRRFYATAEAPQLCLLWADLCLERGWGIATVQAAQALSSDLRLSLDSDSQLQETMPWSLVWRNVDPDMPQNLEAFQRLLSRDTLSAMDREEQLINALSRVLTAGMVAPHEVDRELILKWVHGVTPAFSEASQRKIASWVAQQDQWPQLEVEVPWSTFAGNSRRNLIRTGSYDLEDWQSWSQMFYSGGYTGTRDRVPASRPRVAESEQGALPYYPVVVDGRVYVNTLTRIVAFDLKTGRPWPDIHPALPLYDSGVSQAAFMPLGYPFLGLPRGTLSVDGDFLYACMSRRAVTGSAQGDVPEDGGSFSYLVGLDLKRQGSMLRGFPRRLLPPEFPAAELEGAPLVWGDLLLVAILQRDHVGVRRSVAAFHRFSGKLIWRSGTLASGVVAGSDQANLISHQLLTSAGGRVFYNTNLGSIVCLDALSGAISWLTRYDRDLNQPETVATPDRFRYRDLTPCLVDRGLVYCAPQDCAEIFALDATTGDLVWSTDRNQVDDAIHLLGIYGENLIVSGDRIAWIDRLSGRMIAKFPGSTTPGVANALPDPRGMGRGAISGGEVYWPTSGEVYVFDAEVPDAADKTKINHLPSLHRRVPIGAQASEGGNMVIAGDYLIFVSPRRIMAFGRRMPSEGLSRFP